MTDYSAIAAGARAWPFEEARKLSVRVGGKVPDKGYVLFATGYGPSGLPHLGTFSEVVRTIMVRRAFTALHPEIPTRLFCISDDMDALRKVPTNVPHQESMQNHIGLPVSSVPDPFGTDESFAHHNNRLLREFLDAFGFAYEFVSSSQVYREGRFDTALLKILERYDDVMAVMLPTLGEERRATYSPFLPISPLSGRVLQVPILERKLDAGTIVIEDENGKKTEVPVTGGHCKLQWKIDWPMRWAQLGVDYEMYGKDLIDSAKIGQRIVKILGGRAPDGFAYEHFLDENRQKISKSKGNGLPIAKWLTYAPQESLALYNFTKPRTAKRLHFDVIPKAVDEYLIWQEKFANTDDEAQRFENPVWHIHGDDVPAPEKGVSFALLLNLVAVTNSEDPGVLWGFITQYEPNLDPQSAPRLDQLVHCAVNYYRDFIAPHKSYRKPSSEEQIAIRALANQLSCLTGDESNEDIQTIVYATGMAHGYEKKTLRDWFQALYQVLLGQDQGPRFGSFVKLYGIDKTIELIEDKLSAAL